MPSQFHLYSQDIQGTKEVSTFHLLWLGLEVYPEVKVTKLKHLEVTNSDINKVKQVDSTKVKQLQVDSTKVKQVQVTNSHKFLFCKMNKISQCCVDYYR